MKSKENEYHENKQKQTKIEVSQQVQIDGGIS